MKILGIKAHNFLGITPSSFSTELPSDVSIFVGKNGCGKSILLEQLAHSITGGIASHVNNVRTSMDKFGNPFRMLSLEIELDVMIVKLMFNGGAGGGVNLSVKNKAGERKGKVLYFPPSRDITPPKTRKDLRNFNLNTSLSIFDNTISSVFEDTLVSISDRHIQASHHQLGDVPETEILNRISNAFKVLFPEIELIGAFGHEFLAKKDNQKFSISNLSHGEKQALILLSFVAKEPNLNDSILIIDEPDIGLSKNIKEKLIESLQELNSSMQIIMATHSKEIITSVDPSKVIPLSEQ